jgi:hypothetical protein
MRRFVRLLLAVIVLGAAAAAAAAPQIRVSPGPLSRAHASLEGVAGCGNCHDPGGRGPAAARCLACHKPIAARIAARRGVHRDVVGDCGKCHAEHEGVEHDLRRIDRQAFNHSVETGFALEGAHARVAACSGCHKKRSFLAVSAACASCHPDAHKPSLGQDCARCHAPALPFKQARTQFDHARAAFVLTGAHREVVCQKCHAGGVFRGLRFDTCAGCHTTPHRKPLGPSCASCHVTDHWTTRQLDHAKTGFALAGLHANVACAKCHVGGIRKDLQFDRCAACHQNPHRESIKDDCRKCHTEAGFKGAKLDHAARSGFALAGKHEALECRKCHTSLAPAVPGGASAQAGAGRAGVQAGVGGEPGASPRPAGTARPILDYGGLKAACVACHKDEHKGQYGQACDNCHRPVTFKAAGFAHPRAPEFFGGRHAGLACVKCHARPGAPARATVPSMACGSCHADPHFGQVGVACERCHTTDAAKFAPARFSHDAAPFQLTGKHKPLACAKCHPSETAVFPAGSGTAKRLAPVSRECAACHKDPHLGQVDSRCAACHSPETFQVTSYAHQGLDNVFGTATHARLPCRSCHKKETGQFPAGHGTAVRLRVGRTCLECHP